MSRMMGAKDPHPLPGTPHPMPRTPSRNTPCFQGPSGTLTHHQGPPTCSRDPPPSAKDPPPTSMDHPRDPHPMPTIPKGAHPPLPRTLRDPHPPPGTPDLSQRLPPSARDTRPPQQHPWVPAPTRQAGAVEGPLPQLAAGPPIQAGGGGAGGGGGGLQGGAVRTWGGRGGELGAVE